MKRDLPPSSAPNSLLHLFVALASACGLLAPYSIVRGADARVSLAPDDSFLEIISARTFRWFWETTNAANGLTPDRSPPPSFSSVAAVGFALTAYPIGIERGYVTREQAIERVLTTLRFLLDAPQGTASRGHAGYRGFFYHFLELDTGKRYHRVELSTIDTALLMNGVLFCQSYFDGPGPEEASIRDLADALYGRVEWDWALERPPLLGMGWDPDFGFIAVDYSGYSEATFLYILALGSPTYPIHENIWDVFTSSYVWGEFYGDAHVNFSPLFGHQYASVWIDFRGIQDDFMRAKGIDYFENSRRATYSQRAYAIENPDGWRDYGPDIWGLTACDGPAGVRREVNGEIRRFRAYSARGASLRDVNDDGTISPTAAGGSIVFAPEIVIPALKAMQERYGEHVFTEYGYVDAFNPTFVFGDTRLSHGRIVPDAGWFDDQYLGIDQGPILAMIENYRSEMIWRVMKKNPYIVRGLQRAGFVGGWLEEHPPLTGHEARYRDRTALIREDEGDAIRIVVLGSSTAAGIGPIDISNSWVSRLQAHARNKDSRLRINNFARAGYSTYQLLPTGTPSDEERGWPDSDRNISRAISRRPEAIILSMAESDTARGFSIAEQLQNYETIIAAADAARIPIWIATPFPLDLPEDQQHQLAELRDALIRQYGERAIDFWAVLLGDDDRLDQRYAEKGGGQLNDAGHLVLFEQVVCADVVEAVMRKLQSEGASSPLP